MARDVEKHIYFIDSGSKKKNTASYNRFLMLVKMAELNYPVTLLQAKAIKGRHHRVIKGILLRLAIVAQYCLVPSRKKDDATQHVLFLGSTDPLMALIAFIVSRIKGYQVINERNEFPKAIRESNGINRFLFKALVVWWQYRCFDGLFVMTDSLYNYYSQYTRSNSYIVKLPMTVDFDRFNNLTQPSPYNHDYVFYAGSLSESKDGVETLVQAFCQIQNQSIHLLIAGGSKEQVAYKALEGKINALNLESRVKLLGSLERDLIPHYLNAAKILVLARPDSVQASGGFPTKLGEYLASSTPIIVSNVGEIESYLSNKEVAIVDKNKLESELVITFNRVLDDYDESLKRSSLAYKLAYDNFSTDSNAIVFRRLIDAL